MQIADFLLMSFYLLSVFAVSYVIYSIYQRQFFSFHLLFSLLYFVTFFLGFPISMLLKFGFDANLPSSEGLFFTLVIAVVGYFLYVLSYRFFQSVVGESVKQQEMLAHVVHIETKKRAKLTACLLGGIAVICLGYFISVNGLLLFRLEKYSQIFSPLVNAVALKRFFYFFFPALLIFYFLAPSQKRWWLFLFFTATFGGLTFLAVGGTRANLALALAFFLLLGWIQRYITLKWLLFLSLLAVVAMFFLAQIRYGLDVYGREAWFTFLYLTRDTFSPWENVAKIVTTDIEFQKLMPIVRDFYVYIPKAVWADRPDIVWNTANYFTKSVLGNESGLAISPTLLGSLYIMGGFPLIAFGMILLGGLLFVTDRLFCWGYNHAQPLVLTYCLSNLFNLVVLVREGLEAFFSRWLFFSLIFLLCWGIAFLLIQGKRNE